MKLKAPQGVGDPSVAGVTVTLRDGICEVEAEIGAQLIECFGFVIAESLAPEKAKTPMPPRRTKSAARKS